MRVHRRRMPAVAAGHAGFDVSLRSLPYDLSGLTLLAGQTRNGNQRQNHVKQHKYRENGDHEHWILDSVRISKAPSVRGWSGSAIARTAAGEGSSQDSR